MQQAAAQPSSSSATTSAPAPAPTAPSPAWQERIAGGLITTAPPAFTKDGDFLITCAASVLKVYSVKTGEVVKTLRHKSRVTGFFFNPVNALQLYSAAEEGIIRLWDFEDGVLLKSWRIGGDGKITQAVLDANQRVAYLSISKKDPNSHRVTHLISTFSLGNCTSRVRYTSSRPLARLYVSPRGDYFAALQADRRGFQLFNVNTKDIQSIQHPHRITSLDFHPTEPCVAYGDEAGVIRVNYCLPTDATRPRPKQNRIDRYEWHTSSVSALSFSPDGYYLFSGGFEQVLVLWRLNTKHKIFLPRLGAAISSVTLNEQGTVYAVCCNDNSIRIIDALSRELIMAIQGISLDTGGMPIAIEPRNGLIVTSFKHGSLQRYDPVRDRHVDLVEIVSNPQVEEFERLALASVKQVAFGPKGSYMVTSDHREETDIEPEISIKFWLHDGKQYVLNTAAHKAHSAPITALACHPILPLVASCSKDGKFKLWEQIERPPVPGSKNTTSRPLWVCRSVGDFKQLEATALSFSTDGSLLAVAYGSTITLWDPMSNTFHRSLTFTNCASQTIEHLAFIPSSRYLVSATRAQLFVWDLVRCAVVWSYSIQVKSLAVDMSVNYKANLVFPSPSSLVSSFVVSNGKHIFLFNPSSPKPLHVWMAEKRTVVSLAFMATSSLLPEGRVVYLNDKCELVCLEKKLEKKPDHKTDQEKVSLSMSKVKRAKKEVKEEKLSAFESTFGKLSIAGTTEPSKEAPARDGDTGVLVPREDSGTLFNPSTPQLSHLFNGPSHLLPSPAKIYSSFMEGLLKKAHTHVAHADAAQKPAGAHDAADSAMQLDAPAEAAVNKSQVTTANGVEDAATSKNQHKRQTKATEKTFYDSMFKFFSSYAARDEETEMPASLLNELTATVKRPKQTAKHQGKSKNQEGRSGQKKEANGQSGKTASTPTTTTPAEPTGEVAATTATPTQSTKAQRKEKRASQPTAGADVDAMAVENDTNGGSSSGPREEESQANGTGSRAKTTTPRRSRKSANGPQQQE